MHFKKSGKCIFGVELNAAEQKMIDQEIEKRLADYTRRHNIEFAAMVLYILRKEFQFGEARLRRFYERFDPDLEELINHYELDEEDVAWIATRHLKQDGIDVEAWFNELHPKSRN